MEYVFPLATAYHWSSNCENCEYCTCYLKIVCMTMLKSRQPVRMAGSLQQLVLWETVYCSGWYCSGYFL
jgi:hypothetical protein